MARSVYKCESGKNCGHAISLSAWDRLDGWRDDHDTDDLYIVRSECAKGFEVVQRYRNYCLIRDTCEDRTESSNER